VNNVSEKNEDSLNQARRYAWSLSDSQILDPTDRFGKLPLSLSYLFGAIQCSTTIARINEPRKGMDTNVFIKVEGKKVEIIAERDIFAGGEA
jgi:hypothetical protein